MRENRPSGSEGGATSSRPYPYLSFSPGTTSRSAWSSRTGRRGLLLSEYPRTKSRPNVLKPDPKALISPNKPNLRSLGSPKHHPIWPFLAKPIPEQPRLVSDFGIPKRSHSTLTTAIQRLIAPQPTTYGAWHRHCCSYIKRAVIIRGSGSVGG
jgi:hypothetical protein